MSSKRDIHISKALSYLLRHGAVKENLPFDVNGYIEVERVLNHQRLKSHKCTLEDLHRVVDTNDKKRFNIKLSDDGQTELICAVQGHSIDRIKPDEEVLEVIDTAEKLPKNIIHGTSVRNAIQILKSGSIKRMNRNHIHLSIGITEKDKEVISGMRKSSRVHIYILSEPKILEHLKLYRSMNSVILTPDDINKSLFLLVKIRAASGSDESKDERELINLLDENGIKHEYFN